CGGRHPIFPGEVLAQGGWIISARTPVPYLRTKIASCVPDTRLCEQILPALSVTLGKIHILKKIPVSRLPGRETSRQIKTPVREGVNNRGGVLCWVLARGIYPERCDSISLPSKYIAVCSIPDSGPKNGDAS